MRDTSDGSDPKVAVMRGQRGSTPMSACGESAMWMPTARYSRAAAAPKRRTSASSRSAAKPSVSGQAEKPLPRVLAPTTAWKWLRGSVLIVAGMPRRLSSAARWTALFCSANWAGGRSSRVMKLDM